MKRSHDRADFTADLIVPRRTFQLAGALPSETIPVDIDATGVARVKVFGTAHGTPLKNLTPPVWLISLNTVVPALGDPYDRAWELAGQGKSEAIFDAHLYNPPVDSLNQAGTLRLCARRLMRVRGDLERGTKLANDDVVFASVLWAKRSQNEHDLMKQAIGGTKNEVLLLNYINKTTVRP